jgi:dynein heavy chain
MLYDPSLESLARMKLSSLIVLDVHNRDVIKQLIGKENLQLSSFDWMANMRYYWV